MAHKAVCIDCKVVAVVAERNGEPVGIVCDQCGAKLDQEGVRELLHATMVPILAGSGEVDKPAGPFRFTTCD